MKTILFSLIAAFISIAVFSQTPVPPGPISGIWTLAGSPYLIEGINTIEDGTTLSIEPGVELLWQNDSCPMLVYGQIIAIGTESEKITFTSEDPLGSWGSIRFDSPPMGNDSSQFHYCIFENGQVFGDNPDNSGGAIAIDNFDKLRIDHCSFYNNKAIDASIYPILIGGAISLGESSPIIKNCDFKNNICYAGGAIGCYLESHPKIVNNVFIDNQAIGIEYGQGYGGAISCYTSCSPDIINNTFRENSAINGGGAIACVENCDPLIEHNLIYENTSGWLGGGIELQDTSNAILINNTIVNNSAEYGGGIDLWGCSEPEIINTIIWGNTASAGGNQVYIQDPCCIPNFYYCDIENGQTGFGGAPHTGAYENCIKVDPLFMYFCNCYYHLGLGSPCINTGDPSIFDPDLTNSDIGSHYVDHRTLLALPATDIDYYSFTANWQTAISGWGYMLDVSIDEDFTNFVAGYENLDVGNELSYLVEGLNANTTYFYRIDAYYCMGRSEPSNTIEAFTGFTGTDEAFIPELNIIVFPNPTAWKSEIRYQNSAVQNVTIAIYDITGKQSKIILNEQQNAGDYKIGFDVSDLPDGMYLIRLKAGNESVVSKLLVVH